MAEEIIRPHVYRIPRNDATDNLYRLEDKRDRVIKECALAWLRYQGIDKRMFWKQGLSQAFYDLLNSWDRQATLVAARAFIEDNEEFDPTK